MSKKSCNFAIKFSNDNKTMGLVKKMMMEREEAPFPNIPSRYASIDLFKNAYLYAQLEEHCFKGICSYTQKQTRVCSLRDIILSINTILTMHYGDPDNEAVGWDSSSKEDYEGTGFHRECGGYILPDNRKIYTDIYELLCDNDFIVDHNRLLEDIIDNFGSIRFIQQDPYGLTDAEERLYDWRYITEHSIKMMKDGKSLTEMVEQEDVRLYNILEAIQTAQYPLLKEISLRVFRCVNYDDNKVPPVEYSDLTSPPVKYTKNLRMSQKGDSVFYCSLNKDTTLKEAIKDNNEGYTYIGTFESMHKMHILDLTKIDMDLSIFNQDYNLYYLLLFLRDFCKAISKPIRNDDEQIEYVPTQLITYFFRNCLKYYHRDMSKSDLDGILYSSSKDGTPNAVLFFDNENSEKHLKLLEYETIYKGKVINSSTKKTYK